MVINQTNVISNASVQVLDSTVEATYALNSSGLVDWEFTWETDGPSDPSLDAVHFDFSSISTQCRPGYSVITQATSADVTLSYTALAAGGYSHVLTWKNRSCVPRCVLPFQVESGWTGDTDLSDGTHNLRVRICTGL